MSVNTFEPKIIEIKELQDEITSCIKDHTFQTFLHVFNGLVNFHPAVATFPALLVYGLKVCGPVSGKGGTEDLHDSADLA